MFAKDKHMTITLRQITTHGRLTSSLWKTVSTVDLQVKKNNYVYQILEQLIRIVPTNCKVIILGGREFGTLPMFEKLHKTLGFH
jgi:hypothetical protein